MNIVCPSCSAVYRFDPARIPASGKKVQCSQCNFVFVVRPPGATADEEQTEVVASASVRRSLTGVEMMVDPVPAPKAAASRRLILRQDGTRYSVKDLATLKRWIIERRITRDAELSEDGDTWERVGDRADLTEVFEGLERPATTAPVVATRVATRVEGVRLATTLRPRGEPEEDVFDIEDDDDEDEDDEDLAGVEYDEDEEDFAADLPVVETRTPVLSKANILGGPAAPVGPVAPVTPTAPLVSSSPAAQPAAPRPVGTSPVASAAPVETPRPAMPAPTPTPVATPIREEAPRSNGGLFAALGALVVLVGGIWWITRPEPETPVVARMDDPGGTDPGDADLGPGRVGPVGPPLGPDGRPMANATPPVRAAQGSATPAPVATPAPTPKPTPKPAAVAPTPRPAPAPTPKPRPVQVVSRPTNPTNPTGPRTNPTTPQSPELTGRAAADAAFEQGRTLKDKGDLTGAIAAFKRANQIMPTAQYLEELGWAHLALHDEKRSATDLTTAESFFRESAKRDGSRAGAYLGLGWVYRRQNRIDEAINAVNSCLSRSPDNQTRQEAEGLLRSLEERKAAGG